MPCARLSAAGETLFKGDLKSMSEGELAGVRSRPFVETPYRSEGWLVTESWWRMRWRIEG